MAAKRHGVNAPSPLDSPSKRVNLEGVGVKKKVGVALWNVWAFILVLGSNGTSFLLACSRVVGALLHESGLVLWSTHLMPSGFEFLIYLERFSLRQPVS
jgi:hypothetical protein